MAINLIQKLSVLAATILCLVSFTPGITLAAPVQSYASSGVIITQATKAANNSTSFSEINLTPQVRQQLQAVRQRRNREILAVLNSSQRAKLAHNLRGSNINQALETLKLQPEQQDLVKAILQLSNLKIKAILSRHSLQIGQK